MPVKKRTLIWAGVAVVALATAGTVTAVTVANAEAEETARQCTEATDRGLDVAGIFVRSTLDADDALASIEALELPGDEGWTSTAFADKPGTDDRPSGADLIANVTDAKVEAYAIVIPEGCAEREEASAIHDAADDLEVSLAELDGHVAAMTSDFALFQQDERARVAAEVEAARVAAEQEAARLAAEEAERQRAAEEAARQSQRTSSNSGTSGNSGGSNGSTGGSKPSGPPPGGGVGGGPVAPVCDNGVGGTRPC